MRGLLWALIGAAPWLAQAQSATEVNAEIFRPVPADGFFGVESGRLLPHLQFQVGTFFNVADDPLVAQDQNGDILFRPVSTQGAIDLTAGIGIFGVAEVGVALPIAVVQEGDDLGAIGGGFAVSGGSIGDLRLQGKVRLLGEAGAPEGVFVSLAPELTLPTGNGQEFFGAAGPSVLVGVAGEYRTEKLSVGGLVGPRFQEAVALANLEVGNEIALGVGASYVVNEKASLIGEADGAISLEGGGVGQSPVEVRLGAKFHVAEGFEVPVGVGLGLTDGAGSPDFRLFVGVAFRNNKEGGLSQGDTLRLPGRIYFETGKDTIDPKSYRSLKAAAKTLKKHPEIKKIRIEGHTDDVGDAGRNQALSTKRAEAVRVYLIEQGVEEDRLEVKGYGESKPIEPTEGKTGRQLEAAREKNRRVEFVIVEE